MNAPSWIGRSLGGRYQIEQMLGQGGMSAVYKANDPNLRRVVAVKLIHPHLSGDTRFLHRFEEEAAAVAQLRHPNIIQVFDFNQDSGVYYMVMEFIAGETLQDRLRRSNRFIPLGKAVQYISNICAAIGYAHKRGIIHRDIKPANIMIDVHDQAILMDFGIVKIVGAEKFTATGAVVGTALYLPPEVIRGEAPDARSDIYSLGVTLYEIISGRPPFEADSAMTLMMMHLNDPLPDLASLRPGTPPELVAIVERALAKDRTDRFSSADEFAQALQALLPGLASLDPAGTSSGVSSMPPAQPAAAPAAPQPATEVEPQPQPPQAPKPTSPKPATPKPAPVSTAPAQPVKMPAEPQPSAAATRVTPPAPAASTVQSRPAAEAPRVPAQTPAVGAARPPAGFNLRSPLVLGAGAVILLVLIISGVLLSRGSPPVQQASVNGTPPDEAAISATQPALAAASSTLPALAAASENSPTPTETNAPTATNTPPPTDTPAPTDTPTITPTPTPELFVLIKSIIIENNAFVVDYETFGYTEQLPGMHVHFFYDTVLPENAGMPGSGPWKLYGGPRPFRDYLVSSRPPQATQMCALVANANHSVIQNSGTCMELP